MAHHWHVQKQSTLAYGVQTEPPTPGHGLYLLIEHNHSEAGMRAYHEHAGMWGYMKGTRADADKLEAVYRQHVSAYRESKTFNLRKG